MQKYNFLWKLPRIVANYREIFLLREPTVTRNAVIAAFFFYANYRELPLIIFRELPLIIFMVINGQFMIIRVKKKEDSCAALCYVVRQITHEF